MDCFFFISRNNHFLYFYSYRIVYAMNKYAETDKLLEKINDIADIKAKMTELNIE